MDVLQTADGRLAVHVLRYGMTVHAIRVQHKGTVHDLVCGPENPGDHAHERRFCGSLIGRYANRLPAGRWDTGDVVVDLKEWGPQAAPREGIEQSGPLDTVTWTVVQEPTLFGAHDWAPYEDHVVMAVESPAGDQGYPGRLRIEALTAVEGTTPRVHVAYRARLLDACAATPLNLTQHWGFNLSASDPAHKGKTVEQHTLQMQSPLKLLQLDARGVPTGELIVCDASHDWTQAKRIADRMPEGGYDHFYTWGSTPRRDEPVVVLRGDSGIALSFFTNQAGVQLYTANGASDTAPPRKALHRGDLRDGIRSAAFLEFGAPHATFLHRSLQQYAGTDTLLRAGATYENWVDIVFTLEP